MKWFYKSTIWFFLFYQAAGGYCYAGQKSMHLSAPDLQLEHADGYSSLYIEGYGWMGEAGAPKLPGRIISILLPEGATYIQVQVASVSYSLIPGSFSIAPIAPMFPASSDPFMISEIHSEYQKNQFIYQQDTFYPESSVTCTGVHYQDKTPVVQIKFLPVRYNPVQHILEKVENADVVIHYEDPVEHTVKSVLKRNVQFNPSDVRPSLLVIGSESVSTQLGPYLFWKTCLGYRVSFASVESICQQVSGPTKTEQIRQFLKQKYKNDGTEHVLFVGHRDIIPYQKLYPNPDNHTPAGGVPSDLYYAQINGDWDGDGDGYPGEYEEDHVDLISELHVGRIPFSEPDIVAAILDKIILYEKDDGAWKKNALLMGAISNYKNENHAFEYYVKTDGAVLMEKIKTDIFTLNDVRTLYEKEGNSPSAASCDYPLNRENVFSAWSAGSFGCLSWFSHGSYEALKRKWWDQDNGNEIPESTEIEWQNLITVNDAPINEQYQPVIFANACDNGWPERTSLARQLIRNGASAIVSASREAYNTLGWQEIQDGGTATLSYYFWNCLVQDNSQVGEALESARTDYQSMFHGSWLHLSNLYAFNLFGDPSMTLDGGVPVAGGCEIHICSQCESPAYDLTLTDVMGEILYHENSAEPVQQFYPLDPGYYTVRVKADGMPDTGDEMHVSAGQMETIELTLRAFSPPKLVMNQLTVDIEYNEGDSGHFELIIGNHGEHILSGGIHPLSVHWLSTQEDSFHVLPDTDISLIFRLNGSELQSGVFNTQISLFSNDPQIPELSVPLKLTVADHEPPAAIQDFQIYQINDDSLKMSWQAVGDNGFEGKASAYRIQTKEPDNQILMEISGEHYLPGDTIVAGMPTIWFRDLTSVRVIAVDDAGHCSSSDEQVVSLSTGITGASVCPKSFLYPNFPNPFNMQTLVQFSLAESGPVRIHIFDERGRLTRRLLNEIRSPGTHEVTWDGTDSQSRNVPSGIYLIQIQVKGFSATRKMMLIK
ncbi:T9SS type A sorting domain-containing protein [bacterium]|nr:T9SS type A sorting domain-containing protein [bacterium]